MGVSEFVGYLKGKSTLMMHESKVFIKIIQVIVFTLASDRTKFQESIILFYWLKCLTAFDNGEDANKPFCNRDSVKKGKSTIEFIFVLF